MCCLWLAYAVSQFLVLFFARCLAIRKCSSTHLFIGDRITCFNKSKIVCADSQGESPLMLHYIDAAMRQNREELCFIKGKSKHLVSNHRSFREENANIFRQPYRFKKNMWTFFRSFSCFFYFLTCFREKIRPSSSPLSSFRFSHAHVRLNGHAPTHHALSEFAIPAFTLHLHTQQPDILQLTGELFSHFSASQVKGKRGFSSHLTPYSSTF